MRTRPSATGGSPLAGKEICRLSPGDRYEYIRPAGHKLQLALCSGQPPVASRR